MGACEMLFASGAIAAKKFGLRCWALALARLLCAGAGRVRRGREAGLSGRCAQAFGATRAVLPALGLAFFSTVGGTPISLAGPSAPPATSFGTALGATVSGLRTRGMKGLLATLEQAMSLPRLTCALTGPGLAASLMWAQGSCELPTAKSRTRRLLAPLRGAFLDHDTPGCRVPIQPTPIKTRFQARRPGTTWLQPTDNSLKPTSLE
jgi:hypothetical protein